MVVGTPGRLVKLLRDGTLNLRGCRLLVLDEADQLLAPGFRDDIQLLHKATGSTKGPSQRQQPRGGSAGDGSNHDVGHPGSSAATSEGEAIPSSSNALAGRNAIAGTSGRQSSDVQSKPPGRFIWQTVLVSATLTQSFVNATSHVCPEPLYLSADAGAHGPSSSQASEPDPPRLSTLPRGLDTHAWLEMPPGAPAEAMVSDNSGSSLAASSAPQLPDSLQHFYILSPPNRKVDTMRRCINAKGLKQALVFMNTTQRLKVRLCVVMQDRCLAIMSANRFCGFPV